VYFPSLVRRKLAPSTAYPCRDEHDESTRCSSPEGLNPRTMCYRAAHGEGLVLERRKAGQRALRSSQASRDEIGCAVGGTWGATQCLCLSWLPFYRGALSSRTMSILLSFSQRGRVHVSWSEVVTCAYRARLLRMPVC
jgi:hypothetical protein